MFLCLLGGASVCVLMLLHCYITKYNKNLDTIGKQNYQETGVEAELNFEFFEFYHYIF